ncbi:MAG: tetratricopeptide repeat protein [Alphaproteobacteria bacterium]|nr:tetratricopeptide repeat protein [Alphaproteobacteria bacterium]
MTPREETAADAPRMLGEGLAFHRQGRLDEAERAYRAVLAVLPRHPDALHFLGLVLHQKGDSRAALTFFEQAAHPLGKNADFLANFSLILKGANRWEKAKACARQALFLDPSHMGAAFNLGTILLDEGDHERAAALFRKIPPSDPDRAAAAYLLGKALAGLGRPEDAGRAFREALALDPSDAAGWLALAKAEAAAGRAEAAARSMREAVRAAPGDPGVLAAAAAVADACGDSSGRDLSLAGIRAGGADSLRRLCEIGEAAAGLGAIDAAGDAFRGVLALDPGHVRALWGLRRLLPASYESDAEIPAARAGFADALDHIERAFDPGSPAGVESAFMELAAVTNFYLAYQEQDDRDLQIRFGRLAARIMAARFPQLASAPTPMPEPEPDGRLRIGFFSAYWRRHTVARLFAGWIEKLDRGRFKVFIYRCSTADHCQ